MHRGRTMLLWVGLLSLGGLWRADAADPRIEKIERFGTNRNQVLIHFETPANRRTELQFTGNLRPPAIWTNLYVFPPDPIPNHYIFLDAPASNPCFYRLRITNP